MSPRRRMMSNGPHPASPEDLAERIQAELRPLPVRDARAVRGVRRRYSELIADEERDFVLELANALIGRGIRRWFAYELVAAHPPTFHGLDVDELEALGDGIDSWDTVDPFARILTGPAWLQGRIADDVIHRWASSGDLWWRRTALVSTVALNLRSQGGSGDPERTLAICRLLVGDHEDMIEKALSWALRELVIHDPRAVEGFLVDNDGELAARVRREVRHKLETGLKNPRRGESLRRAGGSA